MRCIPYAPNFCIHFLLGYCGLLGELRHEAFAVGQGPADCPEAGELGEPTGFQGLHRPEAEAVDRLPPEDAPLHLFVYVSPIAAGISDQGLYGQGA